MQTMTLDEFKQALKSQGVSSHEHFAFKCPMCGAVQSGTSLIAAGAGKSFEEVESVLGFSCIGRWTGAKSPRKEHDGEPCNWSLGGLLQTHNLEVLTPDGEHHPRFDIASPGEAKKHETENEKQEAA